MKLSNTEFSITYHNSKPNTSTLVSDYVYHNVDVCSIVSISDKEYNCLLQAAQSHYHNDYNLPAEDVGICDLGFISPK